MLIKHATTLTHLIDVGGHDWAFDGLRYPSFLRSFSNSLTNVFGHKSPCSAARVFQVLRFIFVLFMVVCFIFVSLQRGTTMFSASTESVIGHPVDVVNPSELVNEDGDFYTVHL